MKKFYILLAVLCLFTYIPSCKREIHNEESHEEHEHEHEHEGEEENHSGEIVLSPEMAKLAGVEVGTINRGPFRTAVRTSGTILTSGSGETVLIAKTSGILSWKGGTPSLGRKVSEGEVLASISAEGMTEGNPAAKAAITLDAAKKEYERALELRKDKIISEREFERIEAEYRKASSANGANGIKSSRSGYIKNIYKSEGEYVSEGEAVVSVGTDRRLRLSVDLPLNEVSLLRNISGANFRPAYSSEVFSMENLSGKLLSVAGSSDGMSPYLPVTFEFDNKGDIIPGTYSDVWLLGENKQDVISVPESSLTEEQGEFFVYIRLDEDCYAKRPVKLGGRNGERVEILSGLLEGEEVVTKGAYHVKLSSASVIPGHTHNH